MFSSIFLTFSAKNDEFDSHNRDDVRPRGAGGYDYDDAAGACFTRFSLVFMLNLMKYVLNTN